MYDSAGNVLSVLNPLGVKQSMTYDGNGNVLTVKDSNDVVIQRSTYDYNNNPLEVTDALNNVVKYTYDANGNVKTYTTARNNIYTYNYDGNGNLVKVTDPLDGVAENTYDGRGNQTGLKDQNNNNTVYSYDLLNRLTGETTADGYSDSYAYNANSLLTAYTNKRGQATTYTYDADGRRTGRTTVEGNVTYAYDNNNNLLTVTDSSGTITRVYDSLNRIISYTNTSGQTIGYEYDSVGNLTKLTYPDGKIVRYSYNANNQLAKVQDWANRITIYTYDNNGRLSKTTRPDGSVETYTYNANGQLTNAVDKKADGTIINEYSYEYDADGNVITENSANEPSSITIPSNQMEYGLANRLTNFNGTAISYDADGNMLSTPLGENWGNLSYNSLNYLTNIMVSSSTVLFSCTYDAEGNRTAKVENGIITNFTVNPNAELSQVLMSTKNGETTYYVYGLGLISQENADGYKLYHYDYRGSTTAITNSNGEVTDTVFYDPYGNIISRTGTTDTPFLYVGQYGVETDNSGLYYMRARYYNPTIQRFINVDPIRDGYNWYGYADGKPVSLIDFWGLNSVALRDWFNQKLEFAKSNYSDEQISGAITWDKNANKASVLMVGNGYNCYAEFEAGHGETYIGSDGKMYVDESLLWQSFGYILDPPLEYHPTRDAIILGITAGVFIKVVGYIPSISKPVISAAPIENCFGGRVANSAGQFIGYAREFIQKPKQVLSLPQVKDLCQKASDFGIKISATLEDLAGHSTPGNPWSMPHIHLGNQRIHIPIVDEAVEFIIELLGL